MPGGDANADTEIQNQDKNDVLIIENSLTGYLQGDLNMDGTVNIVDKNNLWLPNAGLGSQVPE